MNIKQFQFRWDDYREKPIYYASGGILPLINILPEQPLPPLDRVCQIQVSPYEIRRNQEKSKLHFVWKTGETKEKEIEGISLVLRVPADDPRLKERYKQHPHIAEQIIALFVDNPKQITIQSSPDPLTQREIPTELLPAWEQVRRWREFLSPRKQHFQHCGCEMMAPDNLEPGVYYCQSVAPRLIKLEPDQTTKEGETESLFDFDPETQPPIVDEDKAYWVLSDHIIIAVFHSFCTKELAEYYDYEAALDEYERQEQIRRETDKQRVNEEAAQRIRAREALEKSIREALLG